MALIDDAISAGRWKNPEAVKDLVEQHKKGNFFQRGLAVAKFITGQGLLNPRTQVTAMLGIREVVTQAANKAAENDALEHEKNGKNDPPAFHKYKPCGVWTRAPDGGGGYTYTFKEAGNLGEVVDDAFLIRTGS